MAGASIEDRLAIHDLFVRYTTALDAGDVETVVDCFTADAALESPVIGKIAGSEAIRSFAERFECEAVKQGNTWRFSRRVVFHDHDYTLEGI